jgi:hypothetical protein
MRTVLQALALWPLLTVVAFGQAAPQPGAPPRERAARPEPPPIPEADRIPARAVSSLVRLGDPMRGRYLVQQLGLAPDLAAELDQLAVAMTGTARPPVAELLELSQKLQQATDAGDVAQEREIRAKVEALIDQPFFEFLTAARKKLSAGDAQRLDQAARRLKDNPAGALSPGLLHDLARQLNLSPEQQKKLRELKEVQRMEISRRGPKFEQADDQKARVLSRVNGGIKAILTPEQVTAFTQRIELLRVDRLPGISEYDAHQLMKLGTPPTPRRPDDRPLPADGSPEQPSGDDQASGPESGSPGSGD